MIQQSHRQVPPDGMAANINGRTLSAYEAAARLVRSLPENQPMVNWLLAAEPITEVAPTIRRILEGVLVKHFSAEHLENIANMGQEASTIHFEHDFTTSDVLPRESEAWRSTSFLMSPLGELVSQEINLALRHQEKIPNILDFGAGFGDCAEKIKQDFGPRIFMHISTLEPIPKRQVDFAHVAAGEYIPKAWDSAFDIIYCQGTIHFSNFPQLVIRNLALCLAPGGSLTLMTEGLTSPDFSGPFRREIIKAHGIDCEPDYQARVHSSVTAPLRRCYYRKLNEELDNLEKLRGITCEWFDEADGWVKAPKEYRHPYYLHIKRPL
jgi:SAM-dependent methyltransferase